MRRAAASGSGEPLESSNYGDEQTLPRSSLLEPRVRGERPTAGPLLGSLLAALVGAPPTRTLAVSRLSR
jgi:hypothetical protein